MLARFPVNHWNYIAGNDIDARPAATYGDIVSTPAGSAHTKGNWTDLVTVTQDCYWIEIVLHNGIAGGGQNYMLDIGIDAAGGTSYSVIIPNLLTGEPQSVPNGGGSKWAFPIRIPAGAQIGARMQYTLGSANNIYVYVRAYGAPSHPHLITFGSVVEAIGVNTGTTAGVSITSGTASEGSWTSLGTTTNRGIFVQSGWGCTDNTAAAVIYHLDVAADNNGTTPKIIQSDSLVRSTATELHSLFNCPLGWSEIKAGTTIYGRAQCSGTADASLTMAAYVVT